ncbi:lipoate--protein ligase family protein [Halobacillus campisalis]|uniref:Biotin/lipoate A/B protein ligase family protein n=1 Tax=Halobacillus campisalis TaxID=435909 RepID=A0ABW2K0C1_9BACI|nr:biotin/lipoate A/B protein ligase family protein [Halobacillus campisalis]
METWYFVDSGHLTPSLNMAMDEKLMNWHRKGLIPPVLRFYGWKPAGLSVGYFQKVKGRIDLEGIEKNGFELVRRQTGGRAVLHDDELTYSVIVSEEHPRMPASVKDAYLVLSQGLLEGFRELHISADFAIPKEKLNTTGSAVCFEEPSWYELIVDGKKAAGSAQTRKKGVILQHGSIPIEVDETKLFDMFIYKNERLKERARHAFGDKAVSINDILDTPVSFEETCDAFKKGFEKGLDIELKPFELNKEQWEEVQELAKEKYSSDDWNYAR